MSATAPYATAWASFWHQTECWLTEHGYTASSIQLYHSALRSLYSHTRLYGGTSPANVRPQYIRNYLNHLARENYSWSWLSSNISALRAIFDRQSRNHLLDGIRTPKRPRTLPVILSVAEVQQIIAQTDNIRDRLLLSLIYSCGMKVKEVCSVKWGDIDLESRKICIRGIARRHVPFSELLTPILTEGKKICPDADYTFKGMTKTSHLSERMAELILKRCVILANTGKPVTLMTLRHSFAVHCLKAGMSIRELQETLGHRHVEPTLIYQRFITSTDAVSPLDKLPSKSACGCSGRSSQPSPPPAIAINCISETPAMLTAVKALNQPSSPIESAKLYCAALRMSIRSRFLCLRR